MIAFSLLIVPIKNARDVAVHEKNQTFSTRTSFMGQVSAMKLASVLCQATFAG